MVLARKIPGTRNFHFDNVNHDDMMRHHYYYDDSYDYYSGYHIPFVCGLFSLKILFENFWRPKINPQTNGMRGDTLNFKKRKKKF